MTIPPTKFHRMSRATANRRGASKKIANVRAARMKRAVSTSVKATPIPLAKSTANVSHKREFWRNVPIPKSRDIRLLRPATLPRGERFETRCDAMRINATRIEHLMNRRPDIAAMIEHCEGQAAPGSLLACARSARWFRICHTAELLRIAEMFEGPHQIATVYLNAYPAGSLGTADMKLAHGALRKKLQRCGFRGVILVGGTEVAWLAKREKWVLHLHLLAIGVPEDAWERLRAALNDVGPAIALKVQALKDLAEQLSYCQKFNSSHKPGKRGPNGQAPYRPLPTERLVEWAEWVAKYRFEDFGFLFGARRHGGRIVPMP